jgi:hypothetical protein
MKMQPRYKTSSYGRKTRMLKNGSREIRSRELLEDLKEEDLD